MLSLLRSDFAQWPCAVPYDLQPLVSPNLYRFVLPFRHEQVPLVEVHKWNSWVLHHSLIISNSWYVLCISFFVTPSSEVILVTSWQVSVAEFLWNERKWRMERLSFKWWVGLIGPKLNLPTGPTLINWVTGDFIFMGPFFLQVNTASVSLSLFLLCNCFYSDCWRSGATSMVTTVLSIIGYQSFLGQCCMLIPPIKSIYIINLHLPPFIQGDNLDTLPLKW